MSMLKLKFDKIMEFNPSIYDEFINSQGKKIIFCEHPFYGDEYPVLVVFPDDKVAFVSDFFETIDMMAEHKEYEPVLIDGGICIYGFENK